MSHSIILQPEREKSLRRRHPWVYSKAVLQVKGKTSVRAKLQTYRPTMANGCVVELIQLTRKFGYAPGLLMKEAI